MNNDQPNTLRSLHITSLAGLEHFARDFSKELNNANSQRIFLYGTLGVGKTTFVRNLLHCMGHHGPVISPTYGLVQSYTLNERTVHHFDCYRIQSAYELIDLDLDAYLDDICLIEWPEQGMAQLVKAHHSLTFSFDTKDTNARVIHWKRHSLS